MQPDLSELENRLWDAADELRANSGLKASEYGTPVLGLIFLRFAETKFEAARAEIQAKASARRRIGPSDYHAQRILYLTEAARFSYLLSLPEGSDLGKAVNEAMRLIEENNPELAGVMPRTYTALESSTIASLLRHINSYTKDLEGDAFGLIYEYFLGKFALAEGQGAGEFFTPMSIVRLIVEIIEPFHGRIFDPACGSGGMFVQSAHFVERHRRSPGDELSIYGQEKTGETVRLAKTNLAIHGLSGEIREGNSYYEDLHKSVGRFDFVMANPPFNVDRVDKAKLEDDRRFPDLPRADNANYLWIQLFATALNDMGPSRLRDGQLGVRRPPQRGRDRRKLIEGRLVDVIVAIGSNFFYTMTLPVTLWFLDRGKRETDRADRVLFIDARQVFRQIDRAHRDFTDEQLELLANMVRLYRGEAPELDHVEKGLFAQRFPDATYIDVPGLCKVATFDEIASQGWSLNPGRYVGTEVEDLDDEVFEEKLAAAQAELRDLATRAETLEHGV
ncbi:MAG TPA: class I SAM-dependent DNA methyltransferase, partial [Solirubrobacteraceae bacterium]|nr:class I SAM-dependent DNA methyltransferase [Solirubrobacteraceae bacterium]